MTDNRQSQPFCDGQFIIVTDIVTEIITVRSVTIFQGGSQNGDFLEKIVTDRGRL